MLSLRDPIHGFVRADPLEAALINSEPVQRLRWIRQLGLTYLVFPGAEHSRFSHALGALELAGRAYDSLASKSGGRLPEGPECRPRRLVRAAALLHDIGHAPFSHSAEELFEGGIDHEEMTCRLLGLERMVAIFERHGAGIEPRDVIDLIAGRGDPLLVQIVSGELDVDKMDYLLRDSLFCGVRYGNFDLERLLDTMVPVQDPLSGAWSVGVEEGGVHALEALIMARYYMFTQVYFTVVSKVLELHLACWLTSEGWRWPADPETFLEEDDLRVVSRMRESSDPHAQAVLRRDLRFPLAFETREHLSRDEKERFEALLPELEERFGAGHLLVSNSAKDPHRMATSRVLVQREGGGFEPVAQFSHFLRHLARIDRYRVYARAELRDAVASALRERWP
ncbi:MAG: HD domain-containing protein [Acidobacteriota bacterium]